MNDTDMPTIVDLSLPMAEVDIIISALNEAADSWSFSDQVRSEGADRLAAFLASMLHGDPRK